MASFSVVGHSPTVNGALVDAKAAKGDAEYPKASTIPPYSIANTSHPNATVDGSAKPAKAPFIQHVATAKPLSPPPLTDDQAAKYESVLLAARSWTEVPNNLSANASKSPLTDSERFWLTRECLLRYLRASKWNTNTALTRLQLTLSWRREWGVEKHTADYISVENETGKQIITGFDNEGRPCLYLNPHKQNTKGEEKQMQHLVFMLERCIDIMPPNQETLALMINFRESRSGQNASISQARLAIYILQNHYPERLGKALVQEVPRLLRFFFAAINPFIDAATSRKLGFDQDLRALVPSEQLINSYGGDADFEYDHGAYWPALNALANARRNDMVKRWEAAGKIIGQSEAYLKGVDEERKLAAPELPIHTQ